MSIRVGDEVLRLPGLYIPNDHRIGLIQQDARTVDRGQRTHIRQEGAVRAQRGVKNKIDDKVGIAIQTARVVDVETVNNAVRELVVTRSVVGILEALGAHAHDKAVRTALLITSKNIEVVEIGRLIFQQQRAIAVAGPERRRAEAERNDAKTQGSGHHSLLLERMELLFERLYGKRRANGFRN